MSIFDTDEADGRAPIVFAEASTGLLRATLLFGSIAVALALVIAPAADRSVSYASRASAASQLDMMATGSIAGPATASNQYIVRRSVLQSSYAAPCVIYANGGSQGPC